MASQDPNEVFKTIVQASYEALCQYGVITRSPDKLAYTSEFTPLYKAVLKNYGKITKSQVHDALINLRKKGKIKAPKLRAIPSH